MSTFSVSNYRKNRTSQYNNIIKNLDSGSYNKDEDTRFWKITSDKAGNGAAIIRFLPPLTDDATPWVKEYSYGFKVKETGKWYIALSPSTIGLSDPVMEKNSEDYNSGDEDRVAAAKNRKRRTQYISNIMVVRDPANPDNEGKVFLFKYGKKIHDMITSKAKPEFDTDEPIYVWDILEGCNLKLRVKRVSDYPNYDNSEWGDVSCLVYDPDDDDAIIKIMSQAYDLKEFVAPERFESYDALKTKFERAIGSSSSQNAAARASKDDTDEDDALLEAVKSTSKDSVRKVESKKIVDDDDDLEDFKRMLDSM